MAKEEGFQVISGGKVGGDVSEEEAKKGLNAEKFPRQRWSQIQAVAIHLKTQRDQADG